MGAVKFGDVTFEPLDDVKYPYNYVRIAEDIASGKLDEINTCRELALKDLWFMVYFCLNVPIANHGFWVQACKDVRTGPTDKTLDMWGREHGKSTVITQGETIQYILGNPDNSNCIFSYSQRAALAFLRSIKYTFETNEFLKYLFPDVLYKNPEKEAWKWGEETGLFVRRKCSKREATLEAYGLLEGMPTGRHFDRRIYDDIETADMACTPEIMQKLKEMFDMSQYLGTVTGSHRVVGTPYHHEGLLMYVMGKKDPATGEPIYTVRKKPATVDGTPNGPSAYLPESRLAELRANKQQFYSQQLLDPTPVSETSLRPESLVEVNVKYIPKNLYKFMSIDPAGTSKAKRNGDSWAIIVGGLFPYRDDDIGASDVYILDMVIEEMPLEEALKTIVQMYLRNGMILKVGVEKVALSAFEIHVANALAAKGKIVTLERGNLELLRPAGRSKEQRVEANLIWPLNNQKIKVASSVPEAFKQRLRLEMQKFPFWHDDGLDALSYFYDMIKGYRFGALPAPEESQVERDAWGNFLKEERSPHAWLVV